MRFRLLTAATALSAMILAAPAFAKPVVIKFSHVVAENTPKGQMANKFKELVDQRLAGKVQVEVYPNSQLFGDNKVLEAMLLGDVQMAAPSLSKIKRYTRSLQLFDLPFLFNDINAVDRFQKSDAGQKLLGSVKNKGLPDDVRGEVQKALNEAIAMGNKVAQDKSIKDKETIINSKRSEVIALAPAQRSKWVEAMKPVWKKFEGDVGKDVIDAAYGSNN
ncbi:MAG: hypothetical protein GY799_30915 [Desulfobulbaceae bacterium]|nr:hypothetical protein [Desulfobulbaceae bacterium]